MIEGGPQRAILCWVDVNYQSEIEGIRRRMHVCSDEECEDQTRDRPEVEELPAG